MHEKVLLSAELKNAGISEYDEVIRNLLTLLKESKNHKIYLFEIFHPCWFIMM